VPDTNPLLIPSILDSIKKALQVPEGFDDYDFDIMMAVNSAIGDVSDLGIGPVGGFMITGPDEVWDQFIGNDPRYEGAKSLIMHKAKLIFDPPTSSHGIAAMQKQIEAQEWRLSARRESTDYQDPVEGVDAL
jgi:hypothetical protein